MTAPTLSLLVCTLPSRIRTTLPVLLEDLQRQIGDGPVEVLAMYDNWRRPVGRKRDDLVQMAAGRYIAFIDDDDTVAPGYVSDILACAALEPPPDCIVFDARFRRIDGGRVTEEYICRYGTEFEYGLSGGTWYGKPAHTMAWRSEIAKRHRFDASMRWGEDMDFAKRAWTDIKTQRRIERVLYFYDYDLQHTEADLHSWGTR